MTENTIHEETQITPPPQEAHEHSHDVPVTVSEDNVATVNVSAEEHELEPYKKHYVKEKTKHVHLQGFRKGKAPEAMVARLFKDEVRQSARDNVLFSKYMKLLQEHKLQPLSEPRLDHIHDGDGKVSATLIVEVLQPVVLGQYLGLEVQKFPPKSVEDGVKKAIAELKQSYPKLTPSENPVEVGNQVIADFVITDGDKELERQTDFRVTLGSNFYFKPFEEQLVGLKAGENKEFDIAFPETYHKEEFRNKTIHFNFTAKEIKVVSEYTDDELAKFLGYEGEAKMVELLTKEVEAKYKDEEHLYYENQLLGQLLTAHQFKIPQRLVDEEIRRIRTERPDMPIEEVNVVAERFVRTDLILHSVYERHPEIQYTQDEFNAKVAELAARANDTVENTIQKLQAAGKLQTYVNYLSNCKVIDFLIEMAEKKEPEVKVTEEKENG